MMHDRIISEDEALQILKNDLRKLALEKHAVELSNSTVERRAEIMVQIDRDLQEELRRRQAKSVPSGPLFH